MNLPYFVLHNLNSEVNNEFIFQLLTVDRKLKLTAPVQKPVKRGSFRKFPVKTVLKMAQTYFLQWGYADPEGTRVCLFLIIKDTPQIMEQKKDQGMGKFK